MIELSKEQKAALVAALERLDYAVHCSGPMRQDLVELRLVRRQVTVEGEREIRLTPAGRIVAGLCKRIYEQEINHDNVIETIRKIHRATCEDFVAVLKDNPVTVPAAPEEKE